MKSNMSDLLFLFFFIFFLNLDGPEEKFMENEPIQYGELSGGGGVMPDPYIFAAA